MKKILIIFELIICIIETKAQIGINTTTPSSASVLEISGNGATGLLIPFVNKANREAMLVNQIKKGMLVCDSTDFSIYMYTSSGWKCLSPFSFIKSYANNSHVFIDSSTLNNKSFGIGISNPQATLHVSGTTQFDGNSTINGTETIVGTFTTDSLKVKSNLSIEGDLTINKNANIGQNLIVKGKISGDGSNITHVNADLLDGHHANYFSCKDTVDNAIKKLTNTKLDSKPFSNPDSVTTLKPLGYYADSIEINDYEILYTKIEHSLFISGNIYIKALKNNNGFMVKSNLLTPCCQNYDFIGHSVSDSALQVKTATLGETVLLTITPYNLIMCKGKFIINNNYRIFFNYFFFGLTSDGQ
jgi:hypothetical protein